MAGLNATTGRDKSGIRLNISGNYGRGATRVYNQQLSHGGSLDLAEGTFTSVGGKLRQQIFMLSLRGRRGTGDRVEIAGIQPAMRSFRGLLRAGRLLVTE